MENAHLSNLRTPAISASRLELKDILLECSTGKRILEVFPCDQAAASGTAGKKPEVHLDRDKLSHKISWLRALVDLYDSQLPLFSTGSGQTFGRLGGSRVAIFLETTEQLCTDQERFASYKEAVCLLTREQLSGMEAVHLYQFGSVVLPSTQGCLAFAADLESCFKYASEWTSSLTSLGQDCNLLGAMKVAAELATVDLACIVVATRPDQTAEVIGDYMLNELTGKDAPRLHLVAFSNADSSTYMILKAVAEDVGGSYHGSFLRENLEGCNSQSYEVEDTERTKLMGELQKTRGVLQQLEALQCGVLGDTVLTSLRDLSMEGPWELGALSEGDSPHSILCTSREWLANHGLEAQKLSLYQMLGPDAYSQSEGFVHSLQKRVTSRVYDAHMPLFKWHDQSNKYLHVDVHMLVQYKHKLARFKQEVEKRLNWLQSGSRVPFGVLGEQNVVMVLDGLPPTAKAHHTFAHNLQLFFEEQLSTRHSFNVIRVGQGYDVWRKGTVVPSLDNLKEAWRWATEHVGYHGNKGLLPSLRHIMEDWAVNGHNYGIYIMLFHPPTDAMDAVCSYLEQKMTGTTVGVTVIYYDVIEGRGRRQLFPALRQLALAGGKGRFHHFKGVSESDDIDEIITELDRMKQFSETVDRILANYCGHCNPDVGGTLCLPSSRPRSAAPQATITSSAREAACRQRNRSYSHEPLPLLLTCKSALKQETFYLDRGLEKGVRVDLEVLPTSISRHKAKLVPIPDKEERMSSKEWLSRYGIEALGLSCDKLVASVEDRSPAAYRHTDPQGRHLLLTAAPQQLKGHCQRLQGVVRRYQKRLRWLHAEMNRTFGSIIEEKAVFLLDISHSMKPHLSSLKGCFDKLLRERPHQLKSFNIIAFATVAHPWKDRCVAASDDSCTAAARWVESLKVGGKVCLLEALRAALCMEPGGIYLVSNGAQTSTADFLLCQLPFLRQQFEHGWKLHTVGFCCQEESERTFLKALAHSSNGRYHTWLPNEMQDDLKVWLNLRAAEHVSDDVKELVEEVTLARGQLHKVKGWLSGAQTYTRLSC